MRVGQDIASRFHYCHRTVVNSEYAHASEDWLTMIEIAILVGHLLAPVSQERSPWNHEGWEKFKVGSSVRMKMEAELGGSTHEGHSKGTLLEITDEKAIVDVVSSTKGRDDISKTWTFSKNALDERQWTNEGEEELLIAGRKVKCRWQEFKKGANEFKLWTSPDIPGGTARMRSSDTRAKITVTFEVVEWEAK